MPPIMIIDSRSAVPSEPPINDDASSQQPPLSSHEVSGSNPSPLFSPAPRRPTPLSHPKGIGFGSTTHDDDSHHQPSDPEPSEAAIGIPGHEMNSGTGPSLPHTTNTTRRSSAVSVPMRDSVYELLNLRAQIAALEPSLVTSDATVVSAPASHPDSRIQGQLLHHYFRLSRSIHNLAYLCHAPTIMTHNCSLVGKRSTSSPIISKTGKNSCGLPRPLVSCRHRGALGVKGEHPALQEWEKVHTSSLECSGALGSGWDLG